MIPRGTLDIDWGSLFSATLRSFSSLDVNQSCNSIERHWDAERPVIVCQSVRSGLDLVLKSVDWPRGSEILMSAVTIPQMAAIVIDRGFVPVPVDVHPKSLAPVIAQLQSRITSHTRAIFVAHLFGSRLDLRQIAVLARQHGLELWEDVAQGFAGDGFPGDVNADISFFSFGMIKAQTAIGGAVLRFQDRNLADQVRALHTGWHEQSTRAFRRKLCRALLLQFLSSHAVFTTIAEVARFARLDLDTWLSQSTRGFKQSEFFEQLRKRPCRALVDLLNRRLLRQDRRWMDQKARLAEDYCRLLSPHVLLGVDANFPSRWVLPIVSHNPQELQSRLTKSGFDATRRASQLQVISVAVNHPEWTTPMSQSWVPQLVYLPLHPALRLPHIQVIASVVNKLEER